MRTMHILKSEPDETIEKLIHTLSENDDVSVKPLFHNKIDWERLVDDIFTHDKVVCWW